jgi:hypothetical protein
MQGFPPHFPGSIVIREWVVVIVPAVYLGTGWRVMPHDSAKPVYSLKFSNMPI